MKRGFTLIELLVVIAIVVILAAILVSVVGHFFGWGTSDVSDGTHEVVFANAWTETTHYGPIRTLYFASDSISGNTFSVKDRETFAKIVVKDRATIVVSGGQIVGVGPGSVVTPMPMGPPNVVPTPATQGLPGPEG